ncbi:MAG: hypothetical protein ABIB11_04030 [Candidatus Omnitrophota bacterium]
MKNTIFFLMLLFLMIFFVQPAYSENKVWSGVNDSTTWNDDDNWFTAGVPTVNDDVTIDLEDGSVTISDDFVAQTLLVGRKAASTLTVENGVFGMISPPVGVDIAVSNYNYGKIVLKGNTGVVTVQGQYKESNETFGAEPSFMFWLE